MNRLSSDSSQITQRDLPELQFGLLRACSRAFTSPRGLSPSHPRAPRTSLRKSSHVTCSQHASPPHSRRLPLIRVGNRKVHFMSRVSLLGSLPPCPQGAEGLCPASLPPPDRLWSPSWYLAVSFTANALVPSFPLDSKSLETNGDLRTETSELRDHCQRQVPVSVVYVTC